VPPMIFVVIFAVCLWLRLSTHVFNDAPRAADIEPRTMTAWMRVQKAVGPVFFLAVVGYALYAFDWNSFSSTKVSDYTLFCKEWTNGRCPGSHWLRGPRVDYSVYPDQQVVIRQRAGQPPDRLLKCVVVDRRNWKCHIPSVLADDAGLVGYTDAEFWTGVEEFGIVRTFSREDEKHVSRWDWVLDGTDQQE
jgi:hypothetical protein